MADAVGYALPALLGGWSKGSFEADDCGHRALWLDGVAPANVHIVSGETVFTISLVVHEHASGDQMLALTAERFWLDGTERPRHAEILGMGESGPTTAGFFWAAVGQDDDE